jgi:anhydro-N-acetylmuramic acid kinase
MSGTSADGVDAALVEVSGVGDRIAVRPLAFQETPLGPLREPILKAAHNEANTEALCLLNVAVAEAFADAARRVADAAGLTLSDVDAIGSHGQTVWHAPGATVIADRSVTGSLQIGNPAVIAARTGVPVVSDFRSADLALGGQGAPLIPLVDWLLFRQPTRSRAIQNLGGIANATFLPAGRDERSVIAFDTGPGNMVLDALAALVTHGRKVCDEGGVIAAGGKVSEVLLASLMEEEYFHRHPPKSTGRELFGIAYALRLRERGRSMGLSDEDVLATTTALTAEAMAQAYRDFLPPVEEVVLGGGGVHNPTLRREIEARLSPVPVRTHEEIGWNGDAKEAVGFALLADRTLQGLPGNLPQVTGAEREAVLGSITFPPH